MLRSLETYPAGPMRDGSWGVDLRRRALVAVLVLLAAFASGCSVTKTREPRLLRLVAHEFQFGLPSRVPAGLTRVRLVNDGGYWHHAELARFDSTMTSEKYLEDFRKGVAFPEGATDMGGPPLVAPTDSVDVVMDLTPGRWAAICFTSAGGISHVKMGMITPFEVIPVDDDSPAREPSNDTVLGLREHTFDFPDTVPIGRRWVRIENRGAEFHEVDIVRLRPGSSAADYRRWKDVDHQMTEPPGVPVGGTSDFGPGGHLWSLVTFTPGQHLLICDIHADAGEVREFVVSPAP